MKKITSAILASTLALFTAASFAAPAAQPAKHEHAHSAPAAKKAAEAKAPAAKAKKKSTNKKVAVKKKLK